MAIGQYAHLEYRKGRAGAERASKIRGAGEGGLDVHHVSAVDGFHRADEQTMLLDFAHGDAVKADRIGAIRGARGKDAG